MTVSTTAAEMVPTDAEDRSTSERQQEMPMIPPTSVILVAAATPSKINDAEANTDPVGNAKRGVNDNAKGAQRIVHSQGVQTRRSSSISDFYDREEPLITNKTKVYKKSKFLIFPNLWGILHLKAVWRCT